MKTQSKILTGLNYFFLVIFLLGAAVQYNDPDSLVWILIYLAASLAIVLFQWSKATWIYPAIVALVSIVWAAALAPDVFAADEFTVIFDEIEMKNVAIEQTREMLGLLIIAAWMIVLTFISVKKRSSGMDKAKNLKEIIN